MHPLRHTPVHQDLTRDKPFIDLYFCSIKLSLTNNWMTVSQKYWCSAISALHIQPKAVSPVHPYTMSFLGAPVLYWLKQSLRAHLILSHAKSCAFHWKWDPVLNSQELAWSHSAKPPVSVPQASSWGCDSWEESSVVLCGCKGTQLNTCRHLQSEGTQKGRSAKSPMLPITQMFQDECWMQEILGWGQWVATLRLNLVLTSSENLPLCLWG